MSDKEKLKETLSALLDDEAGKIDQLELRRLVRSLDEHPDLLALYQRYTMTHAALGGENLHVSSNNFYARLHEALDQETMDDVVTSDHKNSLHVADLPGKSNGAQLPAWFKTVGQIAIAASIAIFVILIVQKPAEITVTTVAVEEQAQPGERLPVVNNTRMVTPDVLNVSAGNRRTVVPSHVSSPVSECVIDGPRADRSLLQWEKTLPAGYVLCKQDSQMQGCEHTAVKIGCYLY